MSAAREALLDRCFEVVRRHGFSHLSLREIAAEAGTSHRMLIYHFGSRDGLLAEVVARMEAAQRALLADLVTDEADIFAVSATFWAQLTSPEVLPAQRLFFEIYVQALYGRDWTAAFRESVIRAWEEPLAELFRRAGVPDSRARAYARLGLAVTRGLGLDLLMTGARDDVDAAMELFGELVRADV
ncbi:TetR/AcrR family transcriptional regulator [Asanoa sp. WMMD1127]|uniref:TetR/AcrR family transcriptional regulator n=1 Tax=Asanoa sp. WMMD1127 TaxID=3016107 RepID=UPI002416F9C4|nr:TetR/AcrR family transcriptional regulator [Asanoa sp. WMMD1127]MDG4820456.1 TetR/AcrR family transcriptional regulator [Asanoa sp. WMMD1127]